MSGSTLLHRWLAPGLGLLLLILGALAAEPSETVLTVSGEIPAPRTWTLAQLAELPHSEIQVTEKGGQMATFSAVPFAKLLEASGVPHGETLRGPALSLVLVVKASDGYQAVFSLAELDPALVEKPLWLADKTGGQPLPAAMAPLRLLVPDEKRHARWVRQVTSLEVVHLPAAPAAVKSAAP